MPEAPQHRTVLAFDFGLKQIGTAVGQTLTASARPLNVVRARDGQPDWNDIQAMITEWRPALVLVGLPLNMDGTESEFCARARKFARRLNGRFGLPVKMMDERLSTREAKERGGYRQSFRDDPVDNLAAQVILESWLNDPAAASEP